MPDDPVPHWRRLVEDALGEGGITLSADVVDELASHLADVYEAERRQGGSHVSALAAVDRVLRAASHSELEQVTRAVSPSSRLVERRPSTAGRWWSDVRF